MTEQTEGESTAAVTPRLVFKEDITEDDIPEFLRKKAERKNPVREPENPVSSMETASESSGISEPVVMEASPIEANIAGEGEGDAMARKPVEPTDLAPPEEGADDVTIEQLQAKQEEIQRRIQAKREAEKKAVIEQIVNVVKTYEIPLDELVEALGGLKVKRKGVKATQKYRDPKTGATWSGRGKEPAWIKGKKRDKFLII